MTEQIHFDADKHEYSLGGQRYENVTTVLSSVLGTDNPWWKRDHRLRGTFVHRITEAIDQGDWDAAATQFPASWGEEDQRKVLARGIAYEKFLEESGFQAIHNEFRVYSVSMELAGTLDKIGRITRGKFAGHIALLDIKTGKPTPLAKLQVALYDLMWREMKHTELYPTVHVILHLREDGSTRPVYITDPEIAQNKIDGISCVNVFKFRKRNGLLK